MSKVTSPFKLYPFQEEAVAYHLAHRYSLNCSEMGLGKTVMALETARRVGQGARVFGPAFLRSSWTGEAARLGVPIDYVPYSQLSKASGDYRPFWIADECHYLKNPMAIRTQVFSSMLENAKPDYFIGMTGTPIKNRVPDFWTLISLCGLDPKGTSGADLRKSSALRGYHGFARYFSYPQTIRVGGGKLVTRYSGIQEARIPELKGLLKDKYIRFLVKDVLEDLPELTRKEVLFETDQLEALELDLEAEFEKFLAGQAIDSAVKAANALLKAPFTAAYCRDLMQDGSGPLVIFTDHLASASKILAGLPGAQIITGGTSMLAREEAVKRFQEGDADMIIATIGSLSVGVTLTAARNVVFNDLSWTPADNLQAEKRIHRIGQKNACVAHYIDGTRTDRAIRNTLFAKLEATAKLIS